MSERLKLRACDTEDLGILSSCLQDAIVPMTEMTYLANERRFVLVASRFRWERVARKRAGAAAYERVNCGVRFEGVGAVRLSRIDRSDRGAVLSLLAITAADGYIDLVFSGGGTIRLEAEAIDCRLDDLDQAWPTRWKPRHPES